MPLLAAVILAVVLALCIASASFYLGWRYVLQPAQPGGRPPVTDVLDLLKVALAVAGGIGAVAALVVALRRQRLNEAEHYISIASDRREETRVFNERFVAASNLLGASDSAAVRMSGVYALAGLANDWNAGRQSCIDVLCGYLRLPYDPDTAQSGERAVRLAVLEAIRNRLSPQVKDGWHNCIFDLREATFDGGSLDFACLIGGTVLLDRSRFVGEGLSWRAGTFSDCRLGCAQIHLDGGDLRFDSSIFKNAIADFSSAKLATGSLRLDRITMMGGYLDFQGLVMSGGFLCFDNAQITASYELSDSNRQDMIDFTKAELAHGRLTFIKTQFKYDRPIKRDELPSRQDRTDWPVTLSFYKAEFKGAEVSFSTADFHDGSVSFNRSVVDGSQLLFTAADFRDALISFRVMKLTSGNLLFDGSNFWQKMPIDEEGVPTYLTELANMSAAERHGIYYDDLHLPPATLDFSSAIFDGGRITFSRVEAAGGIVSFNRMRLQNTEIQFANAVIPRLLIELWHLDISPGVGTVSFDGCAPYLLLSSNMTQEERARLGDLKFLKCYEISGLG